MGGVGTDAGVCTITAVHTQILTDAYTDHTVAHVAKG